MIHDAVLNMQRVQWPAGTTTPRDGWRYGVPLYWAMLFANTAGVWGEGSGCHHLPDSEQKRAKTQCRCRGSHNLAAVPTMKTNLIWMLTRDLIQNPCMVYNMNISLPSLATYDPMFSARLPPVRPDSGLTSVNPVAAQHLLFGPKTRYTW